MSGQMREDGEEGDVGAEVEVGDQVVRKRPPIEAELYIQEPGLNVTILP